MTRLPRPDFPRTLAEFHRMFPSERDCFEYLLRSRWSGQEAACPSCGAGRFFVRGDRLGVACASCRHVLSATAGTVMHRTRLPLRTWLLAAWLVITDKRGSSAKQVQRQLGVSYETAYMILQRLRAAMVHPHREPLHGQVEVDETFVGGVRHGRRGREMDAARMGKFIVLGAVEVLCGPHADMGGLRRPGRIRLRHVADNRAGTLLEFVSDCVAVGSTVVSDGNRSYRAVEGAGYIHRVESTSVGTPRNEVLSRAHLVFSNLKTWLAGTFHGRVEAKHLQGYLNEFCFRFNRRDNLPAAFQTALGIAPWVTGPTYSGLYAEGPGRYQHVREPISRLDPAPTHRAQVGGEVYSAR